MRASTTRLQLALLKAALLLGVNVEVGKGVSSLSDVAGFDVLMLREDRGAVQRSHAKGERRKEADELLHLQLLARPLRGSNRPRAAGSRVLCDVLTPLGFVPSSAQDLALLAQADVLGGVFASTFVKSALQLGAASAYVSLDTFPWCPLLRCFWHWRDLCHNCEART